MTTCARHRCDYLNPMMLHADGDAVFATGEDGGDGGGAFGVPGGGGGDVAADVSCA